MTEADQIKMGHDEVIASLGDRIRMYQSKIAVAEKFKSGSHELPYLRARLTIAEFALASAQEFANKGPGTQWIAVADRLPTGADGNELGLVFWLRSGIQVFGHHSERPIDGTHWRSCK